jgi:photosystem II stability/assembly factor-like uncharacterized protein
MLALLLTAHSSPNANAQSYWQRLVTPTVNDLRSVCFVDSMTGWIAGKLGTIIKTTDGGQSWTLQHANPNADVVQIVMLNGRIGWTISPFYRLDSVSTIGTFIHKTTNGGTDWAQTILPNQLLQSIAFVDSANGSAGGFLGVLFKTSDGGASWIDVTPDSTPRWSVLKIRYQTPQLGLAVGGRFDHGGMILRTRDGGWTWTRDNLTASEPLNDIRFIDSLTAIAVGGDAESGFSVARTSDGGEHWIFDFIGIWGIGQAVSHRTPLEVWSPLGFVGFSLRTQDGGTTWEEIFQPEPTYLYDVQFTDSMHGYMAGDGGAVLKYCDSTLDVVEPPDSRVAPESFVLEQNYPNPFNPETTIRYSLPVDSYATLKVFNLLGQEVATFGMNMQVAGSHEVTWDASNRESGVYFYQLIVGGLTQTRRALLLK